MNEIRESDKAQLQQLMMSHAWKLIEQELDSRISDLNDFLLAPDIDDVLSEIDATKRINLIALKKHERAWLVRLKNLPNEIIDSFVQEIE